MYKRLFITTENAAEAKKIIDAHVKLMPTYELAKAMLKLSERLQSEMLAVIPHPVTGKPKKRLTRFLFSLTQPQGTACRFMYLAITPEQRALFDFRDSEWTNDKR